MDYLDYEGLKYYHSKVKDLINEIKKKIDNNDYNFSFSGLKSAVINLVHNLKQKGEEINVPDLAYSFQKKVPYRKFCKGRYYRGSTQIVAK